MTQGNNVIENEIVSITTNNNNIDNDVHKMKLEQGKKVEIIADRLLKVFGLNETSRAFMCKVAWKLTESRIWQNVEQALKGKNPVGLFIYLCKRDGV